MEMVTNDVHPIGGQSKVKRYGWSVDDRSGSLEWIDKTKLMVDPTYQRRAQTDRILRIAAKWNWVACGVILVARRGGKLPTYYVMDGQHRVMAALKRSDVEKLPCIVFETHEAKEEAGGFIDANTLRRMPTTLEKWNALLVQGDKDVVIADRMIREIGRTPSNKSNPTTVRCLSLILRKMREEPDTFNRIWPLAAKICSGHVFNERILYGFLWIENNIVSSSSLIDKKWRSRLEQVGFENLMGGVRRAASFYANGGAKVWGLGMVDVINKGLQVKLKVRS